MTAVNKQLSFLGEIDSHCFLGTTELDFGMGFGEFNIYGWNYEKLLQF